MLDVAGSQSVIHLSSLAATIPILDFRKFSIFSVYPLGYTSGIQIEIICHRTLILVIPDSVSSQSGIIQRVYTDMSRFARWGRGFRMIRHAIIMTDHPFTLFLLRVKRTHCLCRTREVICCRLSCSSYALLRIGEHGDSRGPAFKGEVLVCVSRTQLLEVAILYTRISNFEVSLASHRIGAPYACLTNAKIALRSKRIFV